MSRSVPTIYYDDVIFNLQRHGGISVYWSKMTTRVSDFSTSFKVQRIGKRFLIPYLGRFLPVFVFADIFHSSYFRLNLNPCSKNVVTVYDFTYELGYLKTVGSFINILQKRLAIWQADVVICISENTKKDLLSLYPSLSKHKKIEVIYLDSSLDVLEDSESSNPEIETIISKFQYVLFVGKRSSYKNFDIVARAFKGFSLSKKNFRLICVGSPFTQLEKNKLSDLGILDKTISLQNIHNAELKILYRNAFSLVYLSFYEGFGLPPLEAMKCGCPVIASNTSSIPEVVEHAGFLLDPSNVREVEIALKKLLDSSVRAFYIELGFQRAQEFSWEKTAQQHLEIYRSLV